MSTENQEAQEDELLALSSIYPEDEFRRADTSPGGEIRVCLELPPNFKISVKSNSSSNTMAESFENTVYFLPPIVLNFEIPPGYPSTTCPIFTLSCKWLSPEQLTLMCQRLDDLWEENRGSVVLFAWMQFLKEETLEYLNIKSPYEVQFTNNGTHTLKHPDEEASLRIAAATPEKEAVDRRATQDVQSVYDLIRHILDFDESQQKKCFDSKPFLCNICFSEKLGSECTYFKDCSHVYCDICLRDYFEIQIRDGQVRSLNCPEPECTSVATPAQVKKLVGEELFGRYDRLLLKSTLEMMTDVVYCPRLSCQTPVMQEPGGTMGICTSCQYAFCTLCMMTYHGVSKCNDPESEFTEPTLEDPNPENPDSLHNEEGDDDQLPSTGKGKGARRKRQQEWESKKWIKENSKNCPRCTSKIQKLYGCNKMACTQCGAYFCWMCGVLLAQWNPYDHFRDTDCTQNS
ncbi:E3 ubiquitin-protein ligase RNF14-like [Rana temporaria]|uniref:E3 ubiquitin-protein ligase RNF14-like n=1 Tax=Rana temporaria TaxID=8407 RepID=UPI001AACA5D1|nr:E3 ubiquitin-protein ligase RNF14-like [Rana temporaria]